MAAHFKKHRLLFGLIFIAGIILLLTYLHTHGIMFDLKMAQMYRMDIEEALMKNMFIGAVLYILIYTTIIAFSLPFATPLTILSGFLFGNIIGTLVVAVAASSGATLSVLINRFFFREFVEYKFGRQLRKLNTELHGNGFRDILLLRLAPVIPFSLINIFAAVTSVRIRDFFFATLIGTLPFTFVYVNAGKELAQLESFSDIISPQVIIGISLIALSVAIPIFIRRRRGGGEQMQLPE